MFCTRRMVIFTAFYALLSLSILFWIGPFQMQTNQTTLVSTKSMIKYEIKLSKRAKE